MTAKATVQVNSVPRRLRSHSSHIAAALALAFLVAGLSGSAVAQRGPLLSTSALPRPDASWAWWEPSEGFSVQALLEKPLSFYSGEDLQCEYANGHVGTLKILRAVTVGAILHPHPDSVRVERWEDLLKVGRRRLTMPDQMLEVGIVPYVAIGGVRLYLVPGGAAARDSYTLACDVRTFHQKLASVPPTLYPAISILVRESAAEFAKEIQILLGQGRTLNLLEVPIVDRFDVPGNRPGTLAELLGRIVEQLVRTGAPGFLDDLPRKPQSGLVVGFPGFDTRSQVWLGPEDLPARLRTGEESRESRRWREQGSSALLDPRRIV